MPKRTLELLKLLDAKDFPPECFPSIHHLGTSLANHRDYCEKRGNFANDDRGDHNRDVRRRLEYIVEHADKAASQGRQVNFTALAYEAVRECPFKKK